MIFLRFKTKTKTSAILAGLLLTATLAATTTMTDEAQAAARQSGNLTVTPDKYFVGGQAQTYTGNIGVKGVRRIWLESNMNREGDTWVRMEGMNGKTKADGSFSISIPAPSMFNISYRVGAQGGYKTPGKLLAGATQELFIWAAQERNDDWENAIDPAANQPFTMVVDTTPEMLPREDTGNLPVFTGRTLTLQKRLDGQQWATVATTTVQENGRGYFPNIVSPAGEVTYQVRQERIYGNGNEIGWRASFPLTLSVTDRVKPHAWWERTPVDAFVGSAPKPQVVASSKYGWYPKFFDFAWEQGQDLDAGPSRGTNLKGKWIPYSDGSGRANPHNGGLGLFSSMAGRPSTGDYGTVRATQSGNARKYGRWEARMRWTTLESAGKDYNIKVELVPNGTKGDVCNVDGIVLGMWNPRSSTVTYGVTKGSKHWKQTKTIKGYSSSGPLLAAEVTPKHITWLIGGKPLATIKNKQAIPNKNLVFRISLEGGAGEYDTTKVYGDWQRGFSLERGKKVVVKKGIKASSTGFC